MACSALGFGFIVDGFRGTTSDAGHAVRAGSLPLGALLFHGDVAQRTTLHAKTAASTVIADGKTFITDDEVIK